MEPESRERVLWSLGFRPFFLLAGLYGSLLLPWWIAVLAGWLSAPAALPATWWHAHEMLFGFVAAAVAGFLLTSVPNWSGSTALSGAPLAALASLWLVGRLALAFSGALPPVVVAVADLAFLPALVAAIAPPLLRARRAQNLGFPVVLLALTGCNVGFHLEAAGLAGSASTGLRAALGLVALLVVVIGGRIVPLFTANALRSTGVELRRSRVFDLLAVPAVLLALGCDAFAPRTTRSGAAAAFAALVLVLRMSGWQTRRTSGEPLLWSLHLGYGWLPLSFALLALADLTHAIPWTSAIHALTTGAFGTMILAVMTRVSLGHTGRPLRAPAAASAAYLLVSGAAVVRTFAVLAWPQYSLALWAGAGGLWSAAFALFTVRYFGVLTRPRADGRPG